MSISGAGAPVVEAVRDARIGRIRFPSVFEGVKEPLGETIEVTGSATAPGERRPRPFDLTLPIHGDPYDTDSTGVGERLRRQVVGWLENEKARLSLPFFAFDADPHLNCWLIIGGGEVEYADGGPTLSDYKLALSDCFRKGTPRTHRPARQVRLIDRRDPSVPRDYLWTFYSDDFAAEVALPRTFLPIGAERILASGAIPLTASTIASLDGSVPYVDNRTDGDLLSFDHDEAEHNLGDVVALDRRGYTAPTYTLAHDPDPQEHYGWEELYGINQEQTEGDVPVLQNGLCRVRYVADKQALALDAYVSGTGYVEQGRVTLWRDYPAATETRYDTLIDGKLVDWSPEKAVVKLLLGISTTDVCEAYVTLQRGWAGPRVEAYGRWSSAGKPGTAIRLIPYTAGATTGGSSTGSSTLVDGTDYGNYTAREAWGYLLPQSPNLSLNFAVLQELVKVIGRADTQAYGATRNGISLVARDATAVEGYASMTIGIGPRASAAADADTLGQTNLYDSIAVPALVSKGC